MGDLPKLCKHGMIWGYCLSCNYEELHVNNTTDQLAAPSANNGGASSYYELPPDCQTIQDIIVRKDMGFTQGNIFKACYRWDAKPDLEYNLNKIIWFAQDALDRLYETHPDNPRGNCYEGKRPDHL